MGLHVRDQVPLAIMALLDPLKPATLASVLQRDEDEDQALNALALPAALVAAPKEIIKPAGMTGHPNPQDRAMTVLLVLVVQMTGNLHAALNALAVPVEAALYGTRVAKSLGGIAKFGRVAATEIVVNREGAAPVGLLRMQLEYVVRTNEGSPDVPLQVS